MRDNLQNIFYISDNTSLYRKNTKKLLEKTVLPVLLWQLLYKASARKHRRQLQWCAKVWNHLFFTEKSSISNINQLTNSVFDPVLLLLVAGCIIFVIGFFGCVGALRENTIMLILVNILPYFCYFTFAVFSVVVNAKYIEEFVIIVVVAFI